MRRLLPLVLLLACGAAAAATPRVQVQVEGVDGPLLKNVLAYLSISTYEDAPNLTDTLVERLNARAPDEIRQALQPFGYYGTEVKATLASTSTGWLAHYVITLPPPVKLRHIDVTLDGEGRGDPSYDQFFSALPIAAGDSLDQAKYEAVKQRMQEIASRHGYIDAQFTTAKLEVDPQEHWADVTLVFDTGPRYYFGDVTFVQDFMDEPFLRRYVKFKPGDPYDNNQVLALQYALNDSGYFSGVNLEVLRQQAMERRIPIRITLTAAKRNKYSIGLGYGTDTGPRVTLGWTNRRINGLGHSMAAQAQFSHVLESGLLTYTVPLSDPAAERLVYSLSNSRQVFDTNIVYTSALGVSRYTAWGAWSEVQYLQLEHDRSILANGSAAAAVTPGLVFNTTLLMPGVTFSRSVSDSLVLPTEGYRMSADLRGANNALLSDTSFLQLHLQAKLIVPLGDYTHLLLRGELGASAVKSFDELPVSQRFYAGGDQSVRGFAYNSLGTRDPVTGVLVGGQDLQVASVEIDHFFGRLFGVAGFVDAGDATNSFTVSLEKGVGGGLRWRTPVGMVRVDLAHPVKRPDLDQVRLHVSIGPDL